MANDKNPNIRSEARDASGGLPPIKRRLRTAIPLNQLPSTRVVDLPWERVTEANGAEVLGCEGASLMPWTGRRVRPEYPWIVVDNVRSPTMDRIEMEYGDEALYEKERRLEEYPACVLSPLDECSSALVREIRRIANSHAKELVCPDILPCAPRPDGTAVLTAGCDGDDWIGFAQYGCTVSEGKEVRIDATLYFVYIRPEQRRRGWAPILSAMIGGGLAEALHQTLRESPPRGPGSLQVSALYPIRYAAYLEASFAQALAPSLVSQQWCTEYRGPRIRTGADR
jgi:hypothetical protein